MLLTVCSIPSTIPDEQELVQELMQAGLAVFHLRKPSFSKEDMKTWLQRLTKDQQQKVVLHSHWQLADELELKGLHFGASALKNMQTDEQQKWLSYAKQNNLTVSSSVHTPEEIDRLPMGLDYVSLSPIHESISKQGYKPVYHAWQFNDWLKELQTRKNIQVLALGGIKEEYLSALSQRGFDGVMILGAIWENIHDINDKKIIRQRIEQWIATCNSFPTF